MTEMPKFGCDVGVEVQLIMRIDYFGPLTP